MNPPCIVEQASVEDLPQLVELLIEGVPSGFYDRSTLTEGVKAALEEPAQSRIFVVREQRRILGMATLRITISTAEGGFVAILSDVVVAPASRNQGIGSRLLDAVRSYAVAEGLSRITLMPEFLSASTRNFFQKRGFADSEMIPMRLSLSAVQKF